MIKYININSYLIKKNLYIQSKQDITFSKFFKRLAIFYKRSIFKIKSFFRKYYIKLPSLLNLFMQYNKFNLGSEKFIIFGLFSKYKRLQKKKKRIKLIKILKNKEELTLLKGKFKRILKKSILLIKRKRREKFNSKKKKRKNKRAMPYQTHDITPLLNTLISNVKFQKVKNKFFRYCRVYFKFTGSNIYGTITNSLGEVKYIYSGGNFINLRTRKEKTTIFVAQNIGELIASRLQKSNAREIFFFPCINHTKARILLRYFGRGLKLIRFFRFSKVFLKKKVMRNGVRLRKVARK